MAVRFINIGKRLIAQYNFRIAISKLFKLTVFAIKVRRNSPAYWQWLREEERSFASYYKYVVDQDSSRISICIPMYKPNMQHFKKAVQSVINQTDNSWELCLADDCSNSDDLTLFIDELRNKYGTAKVKFKQRQENGNISKCTNTAISLATSEWILLLDQDDELSAHIIYVLRAAISSNPGALLIYTDEDKIDDKGKRFDPYFKSSFNPELLRSHNLFTHALAFNKRLIQKIGEFKSEYDGAQDYDFVLRAIEVVRPDQIIHIPRILYHWRAHVKSTALCSEAKPYAMQSGCRALQEHLKRLNVAGNVELNNNNSFRISYQLPENHPLVSVIIPTRDQTQLVRRLLEGLENKTDYRNIEVILVDNGSSSSSFHAFSRIFEDKPSKLKKRLIRIDEEFNYSRLNNCAIKFSEGKFLCLLNNDTEIVHDSWLKELISICNRNEVGAVGPMLLYPDHTVQHAGIVLGIGGWAGHLHKGFPVDHPGSANRLQVNSNFTAVTGACLVTPRAVWDELGGFNETKLKVACSDVDYCLRIWQIGKQVIYTPHARLIHHESKSRGHEDTPIKKQRFRSEVLYMKANWKKVIANDPFYNPNFTLTKEDCSLAVGFAPPLRWRKGFENL